MLPSSDPEFRTDKEVLVSSSEEATLMVAESMGHKATHHEPEPSLEATFLMAAETLNATIAYGAGIGLILAGFIVAGFDDERHGDRGRRKRERRR